MSPTPPLRLVFVLFDGFSNMVLASAVEPLRAARDLVPEAPFTWRLATLDGQPARSSSGLEVSPDEALARSGACDTFFLVCGYGARQRATKPALAAIRRAARKSARLGGLDMGAWLLAEAGLLDGHRATVHWQELEAFEETFLDVRASAERFVIDGNRITAGGASTVMALMLEMIREAGGDALAFDVSNLFVYDVERNYRRDRGARSGAMARVPQLEQAITEMRSRVEEPAALPEIAAAAGLSPRTLDRLFHRELGLPPGRYYQMIRLNLARALAEETGLPVAEIAARCGFVSTATLSRAFSASFGRTIRDLRRHRARRAGLSQEKVKGSRPV